MTNVEGLAEASSTVKKLRESSFIAQRRHLASTVRYDFSRPYEASASYARESDRGALPLAQVTRRASGATKTSDSLIKGWSLALVRPITRPRGRVDKIPRDFKVTPPPRLPSDEAETGTGLNFKWPLRGEGLRPGRDRSAGSPLEACRTISFRRRGAAPQCVGRKRKQSDPGSGIRFKALHASGMTETSHSCGHHASPSHVDLGDCYGA